MHHAENRCFQLNRGQFLQQSWSYTSSGGYLTFVAATSGGGVAINDDQQGVIQLDSSGNPSAPVASLQGAAPYEMWAPASTSLNTGLGLWTNISTTPTVTLTFVVGDAEPLAASIYAEPASGPQRQRSAIPVPTHLSYDLGQKTELSAQPFACGGRIVIGAGYYGYAYCATAKVFDKNKHIINNQQFRIWETVQPVPGANPPGNNLQTTQGIGIAPYLNGTFLDNPAFYFPVAAGHPQPGQFYKAKQFLTITLNLKSYSNLRINCHNFQSDSDTVTDATSTPYASCQ